MLARGIYVGSGPSVLGRGEPAYGFDLIFDAALAMAVLSSTAQAVGAREDRRRN